MHSRARHLVSVAVLSAAWTAVASLAQANHAPGQPPAGPVTICFLGDTATGLNWPPFTAPRFAGTGRPFTIKVHQLCKDAGAHAVVHSGDLDYIQDAPAFEAFIDEQMGHDFPYFYVLGNHEYEQIWLPALYKANLQARLERLGIAWIGDPVEQYAFDWRGIRFIFTTPGAETAGRASSPYKDPDVAGAFIREHATASPSPWVISAWHMNQTMMQTGAKLDTAGWPPYEESRLAGATIWTAHEHAYARTHLLSNTVTQEIADDTGPYTIAPGKTIVVVTGTSGAALRPAQPQAYLPYWAKVYTVSEGATYGATICTFGAGGDFTRADCVFRNIDNVDVDQWTMFSERGDRTGPVIEASISGPAGAHGWYTGDVTVTWNATDPESGILSSSNCQPVALTAETLGTDITCTATNGVGMQASKTATIRIGHEKVGYFSGKAQGVGRGPGQTGAGIVGTFVLPAESIDLSRVPATVTIAHLLHDGDRDVLGVPVTLIADPRNHATTAYFRTAAGVVPRVSLSIHDRGADFTFRIDVDHATSEPSEHCPDTIRTTAFVIDDGVHPEVLVATQEPWLCFGTGHQYLRTTP